MKNNKINNEKILSIIANNLKISNTRIKLESKQSDFVEWDSLANMRIYLDIGKLLNKRLPNDLIFKLNSVKSIIEIIKKQR